MMPVGTVQVSWFGSKVAQMILISLSVWRIDAVKMRLLAER